MPDDQKKIIYIAGWDRSGSTLLERTLAQVPGFFSVGELVHLWEGGSPDILCECGEAIRNCEVWCRTFREAFAVSPADFDFPTVDELRRRCARSRHVVLLPNRQWRSLMRSSLDPYLSINRRLYQAVASVTGSNVIVDSSKEPAHGYLLQLAQIAELFIVHLVRDPRGCCYSYSVQKAHPDPTVGHFPTRHPAASAFPWMFTNVATGMLWSKLRERYTLIRYEDFIARPRETVARIVEFIGESVPPSVLPFASEHEVFLRSNHGLLGNPVRFQNGLVSLKFDERWRRTMKRGDKWAVTAITAPVLPKYGYWPMGMRNGGVQPA